MVAVGLGLCRFCVSVCVFRTMGMQRFVFGSLGPMGRVFGGFRIMDHLNNSTAPCGLHIIGSTSWLVFKMVLLRKLLFRPLACYTGRVLNIIFAACLGSVRGCKSVLQVLYIALLLSHLGPSIWVSLCWAWCMLSFPWADDENDT